MSFTSSSIDPEKGLPSPSTLDKIYRRLDMRIIPALWCLYFLQSYGSSAYGVSLTMNGDQGHSLSQTLNLSSHNISTASALYYVGYILFDVPMNLVMTKVAPQAWLSRIVATVGILYACYTALTSAGGLIAVRFLTGICGAGTWPGMAYYISLWYPHHRSARRIGYYFTAAQISAAAAGLISAGFQKMDQVRGLAGFQWMFMIYGCVTFLCGVSLLWWLPDRPFPASVPTSRLGRLFARLCPRQIPPLSSETDRELHRQDIRARYKSVSWTLKDLWPILIDPRLWPLVLMYFGVVGTGYGLAVFGTTIIKVNQPSLSSINVSLLYAPIWLCDLAGILLITPIADKFPRRRGLIFCASVVVIIVGLVVATFAPGSWGRYIGLLVCGFGLGPTVPITMTLTAELLVPRHGDVGSAAGAALVSGLGNLGTVTSTYALYNGWPSDKARRFRNSNMVLVGILGMSILACLCSGLVRRYFGGEESSGAEDMEIEEVEREEIEEEKER